MSQWQRHGVALLSGLLFACSASKTPAPVQGLSGGTPSAARYQGQQRVLTGNEYVVQRGDTLYSIAFNAGTNVPALAGVNNIAPPYTIYPGQRLRLHVFESQSRSPVTASSSLAKVPAPVVSRGAVMADPVVKPSGQTTTWVEKKTIAPPAPKEYAREAAQNNDTPSSSATEWRWPAEGKIVEGFSTAEQGNKGIDIAGRKGQPVYAAGDGKVVYAGSALRGYGKLIILKHDEDYLSAYAHNDSLRVQEGQTVKQGMVIADMGNSDAPDVRLHFEIRYKGKSVNPMTYLPKR